jgi:hypothetical protein
VDRSSTSGGPSLYVSLRPQVTRFSSLVAITWAIAVAAALTATLGSLSTDDFDGLNNIFQIPFALPWFLIPIGGIWSDEVDAWVVAGMGWGNAVILLLFLSPWLDRRPASARGPSDS